MVSDAADAVSREVECLLMALISCSFDDYYVQYSAKRGLQCGLRTPQLFGLGKGSLKRFRLRGPGLGIQLRGLALDS